MLIMQLSQPLILIFQFFKIFQQRTSAPLSLNLVPSLHKALIYIYKSKVNVNWNWKTNGTFQPNLISLSVDNKKYS